MVLLHLYYYYKLTLIWYLNKYAKNFNFISILILEYFINKSYY